MANWIYNDGGRAQAGYKGTAKDCVARSIAIATGESYKSVYKALADMMSAHGYSRSARNSIPTSICKKYLEAQGFEYIDATPLGAEQGTTFDKAQLPMRGTIILHMKRHVCAVIDGVINDTYESTEAGTRPVFGYWIR